MFDQLIQLLNQLEATLAAGEVRSRTKYAAILGSIERESITLSNQRHKTSGSASLLSRIRSLAQSCRVALDERELTLKELRIISRDKFAVFNKGLQTMQAGSLSDTHREQIRDTHESSVKDAEVDSILEKLKLEPRVTFEKIRVLGTQETRRVKKVHTEEHERDVATVKRVLLELSLDELRRLDLDALRADIGELVVQVFSTPNTREGIKQAVTFTRHYVQKTDDEFRALVDSYKNINSWLPVKIKGAFSAVRFPVVPPFHDIAAYRDPSKLTNAGFVVTVIGDNFIVLENQYLLVIDMEKVFGISGHRDKKKFKMSRSEEMKQANTL